MLLGAGIFSQIQKGNVRHLATANSIVIIDTIFEWALRDISICSLHYLVSRGLYSRFLTPWTMCQLKTCSGNFINSRRFLMFLLSLLLTKQLKPFILLLLPVLPLEYILEGSLSTNLHNVLPAPKILLCVTFSL